MSLIKNWLLNITGIIHSIKSENLSWQTANQAEIARLKQAQILAEQMLAAELKKKTVELAHDIALLQTKHDAALTMYKTRCEQDIKDYRQYLAALDQLKQSICKSYRHLPEAVAFTIHHHAKHLLNKMWECDDFKEKMVYEMELLTFMTTVHEETSSYLEGKTTEKLPERTLGLLKGQ